MSSNTRARLGAQGWLAQLFVWACLAGPAAAMAATAVDAVPAPGASAQDASQDAIDVRDLGAFVDGFVEARMESHHVVGVTVSVVHRGETIFARGYGHDDLEAGRVVAADRSLFRPGSISKTFTWTAIMQLQEQGKLDLDADIQGYLPNLHIARTFAEPITLAHLMAHTPGFEDSAMGHLFAGAPDKVATLIDYLSSHQPARVRPPGVKPAYSNYGTALAGLIIENVSGISWEDYVERHLFEPLGMHDSTFREPWGDQRAAPMPARLRENVSKGYVRRAGAYRASDFEFIGQIGPAGALSTTATDMARWMLAHLNDGRLGDAVILRPDTARRMHQRHFGTDPRLPGIAHGFIESRLHGYRAIGHGGGTVHFLSDMQLIPDLDFGVFISTNTAEGGYALQLEFVRALVTRYFPAGPEAAADQAAADPERPLREYAGTYLSTRRPYTTVERLFMTSGARVRIDGEHLIIASAMGERRLHPLGGDAFRDADTGDLVVFSAGANGAVAALLLPVPVMVMEKVGALDSPDVLFGLLAVGAFVLACALVGAWLRRNRPLPQTPAEAWAARTAVVTASAWLLVYAVAAAGLAPIAGDISLAFYAFPSPAVLAALGLGLVAAVLTLLAVMLLYPVWREGSWPLWRRIRHTGVVLAALATLLVLRDFNAIGFNLP
jgi:CubicO group peptidase (beta-lactamase class C family)